MNASPQILADLRNHQIICRELLGLAERESQALRSSQAAALTAIYQARQTLLPRLSQSLGKIKEHRLQWKNLTPAERAAQPEIQFLIRQVQELIMRIIVLDRENEQGLLRRGLVPPREIPSLNQQRPHFVADLYRRQQAPESRSV